MLKSILFTSLSAFILSSTAHAADKNLIQAVQKATINPHTATVGQKAVLSFLTNNTYSCDATLSLNPAINVLENNAAPSWVVELANQVFLQNKTLSANDLDKLKVFQTDKAKTASHIKVSGVSPSLSWAVEKLVQRTDVPGMELPAANVELSGLSVNKSAGLFEVRMLITYDNGQEIDLNFKDAPVGSGDSEAGIARLIVAAVAHREVLSSENSLRQEMHALRYNLLKLMRVAGESDVGVRAVLIADGLKDFKIKLLERQRTGMGRGFLTLLQAKAQLVNQAKPSVQAMVAAMKSGDKTFVQNLGGTTVRSFTPSGAFAGKVAGSVKGKRRPPEEAVAWDWRTQPTSNETDFVLTYLWITDPTFMITHPWYWGTKDQSFLMPFMLFQSMEARRNANQVSAFEPEQSYDMRRFENPINPIFTKSADQPVIEGWATDSAVGMKLIEPQVDSRGGVTWVGRDGKEHDIYELGQEDLGKGWKSATGQDLPVSPAETPSHTIDFGRGNSGEADAFKSGSGGSGWNQPENNSRDETIRSS